MKNIYLNYKKSYKDSFFLGCIIGALIFIIIYGVSPIIPTNTNWLLHSNDLEGSIDLTQHYMGWVFYRNSPWTFPLGLTQGLYSKPVSVIYTDSIPLFAIFFKILSPLLPSNFQYMGIYGLTCYTLMGGFASLLIRKFNPNFLVNGIAACFFCLAPVLLNRMYLHTALSAHFVIIIAFCLWAYRDCFSRAKYIRLWSYLLVCATLINAYFTPIILGILLCSLLQELISGDSIKVVIAPIVFPMGFTMLASYMMGMFSGDTNANGSGGLDLLSFNLDGFFNPSTYRTLFGHGMEEHFFKIVSYSKLLPNLPLIGPYQNEGFAYLGLGMTALCLLAFISFIKILVDVFSRKEYENLGSRAWSIRKFWSYFVSLLLCGLVFGYLSLSPQWTIGNKNLIYINYPEFIRSILNIFRSTARFIWPVYYLIFAACFILPSLAFTKRSMPEKQILTNEKAISEYHHIAQIVLTIIFTLCLAIQVYDLSDAIISKHRTFKTVSTKESKYESPMTSSKWNTLLTGKSKVMVYEPTLNLYYDGICAMNIEIFANEHNLSMNMSYMSRDLTEFADKEVQELFKKRAQGQQFDDTIYFFINIKEEDLPDANTYHLTYYNIDGFTVAVDAD